MITPGTLPRPDMVCTGWFNGWPTWLGGNGREWLHCCQAHDLSDLSLTAAIDLGSCVAHTGNAVMGLTMLIGVAILCPIYIFIKRRLMR